METNKTIRTFFGIPLDNNLRDSAAKVIDYLKPQKIGKLSRWVQPEKIHITLRFLGDTKQEQLEKIINDTENNLQNIESFSINIGNVALFPPNNPHVISIESTLNEQLAKVYYQVNKAVVSNGFAAEKRAYLPHLTLARIKTYRPPPLPQVPINIPNKLTVTTINYYQSILTDHGSEYHIIKQFKLIMTSKN